jgi:energy-coupling factor transport system ATP-binding protein
VIVGAPAAVLRQASISPPVVELARLAGWEPPPLSVRDARRAAIDLRAALSGAPREAPAPTPGDAVTGGLVCKSLVVQHGATVAVRGADVSVAPGEVVAVMGRNGSGKSSLLWALCGALRRSGGMVTAVGADPARLSRRDAASVIALVPQQATDLVYHPSIGAECVAADSAAGLKPGSTRELFERLAGAQIAETTHPRDLSDGQRLALALAVQLVAAPRIVLLDEPTRGLDYAAKARLRQILADLARAGRAVVVATHDVEFVARAAQRVLVMAEGEIVTDGPVAEALAASPVFAPQVAKVLAPLPMLTVDDVAAALSAQEAARG